MGVRAEMTADATAIRPFTIETTDCPGTRRSALGLGKPVDDGGGLPPISTSPLSSHPAGHDHKMGSLAAAGVPMLGAARPLLLQ